MLISYFLFVWAIFLETTATSVTVMSRGRMRAVGNSGIIVLLNRYAMWVGSCLIARPSQTG